MVTASGEWDILDLESFIDRPWLCRLFALEASPDKWLLTIRAAQPKSGRLCLNLRTGLDHL